MQEVIKYFVSISMNAIFPNIPEIRIELKCSRLLFRKPLHLSHASLLDLEESEMIPS